MWDLMYPRAYKPQSYGARNGARNGASGGGGGGDGYAAGRRCRDCRAPIGLATYNGVRLNLLYCKAHFCKFFVPPMQVCQNKNNGRTGYCDAHLRCQDTSDEGGQCWRWVKDQNSPAKFQYCKDHSCLAPHCPTQRTDPSTPNCALHRCHTPFCDKPKQQQHSTADTTTGSFFCDKHTCLAVACLAQVPGSAAGTDPAAHYCDLHRPCAAADCSRPCFTRAAGGPAARFCGAHYCVVAACDAPRLVLGGGERCREHTCDETDCVRGKKTATGGGCCGGGRFCEEHSCKTGGCCDRRDKRYPAAEYCPLHTCVIPECARKGSEGGGRCEIHRECMEDGCREWVFVERGRDGDFRHPVCEKHHRPRCSAPTLLNTPCNAPLPLPTSSSQQPAPRFCPDHTCTFPSCANARPPDSLSFCTAHKCASTSTAGGGCQEQVKNASSTLTTTARLLLLAGSGLLASGAGGGGSRFCAAHACRGDDGRCGAEVAAAAGGADGGVGGGRKRGGGGGDGGVEARRFCARHACSHRGCRAEATRTSRRRRGLCDRHYRRQRRDGEGGGGGGGGGGQFGMMGGPGPGGPFGGMGGAGPMGMMAPGFPPFFNGGGGGGGGYESSSDSSSDSDGRRSMGSMGLPFGAPFFY